MKTEIWKLHPYIAGIEVSTMGRVRSLDKVVPCRGNGTRLVKGRVLKQCNVYGGYLQVSVKVDGKWTNKYVNRLIAQTFIPTPDSLKEVNHKDCDRTNNNVDNLEWCSRSYNIQYREKFGKASVHPVFAVNLTTLEVSQYPSQIEASRKLGVAQPNINAVIKGRLKQTCGYWFVKDDGHAVDVVKSKLHDIGGIGLKIKQGR